MREGKPKFETRASREREKEKGDIEELEYPLSKILQDLRPELRRGAYKVVLGDDASGRIPALILAKAINTIYSSYGHEKVLVRFVIGGSRYRRRENRLANKSDMKDQMQRIGQDAGIDTEEETSRIVRALKKLFSSTSEGRHKVLIVTDAIATGIPTRFLVESLSANGLNADVAAVGLVDMEEREAARKIGAKVVIGSTNGPAVYGKSSISGVSGEGSLIFAHPVRQDVGEIEEAQVQKSINHARNITDQVAGRIADDYFSKENTSNISLNA